MSNKITSLLFRSQLFLVLMALLFMSGCKTFTHYNSNKHYNYEMQSYNATCDQLKNRLKQLEYRKQYVRRNDKFMLRYMLIIPTFIETYRMHKEEKEIKKEEDQIRELLLNKHCDRPANLQNKPNIMPENNNSYSNYYSAPIDYNNNYYSYGMSQ